MKQITFLTGRNSDCLSYEILNRIKNLAQNKKHVILIVPALPKTFMLKSWAKHFWQK